LRSTKRLPAARALFLATNYLIYLALWPIRRAIFRAEANSLPALREGALPDVSAATGLGPARPIDPDDGSLPPFPRERPGWGQPRLRRSLCRLGTSGGPADQHHLLHRAAEEVRGAAALGQQVEKSVGLGDPHAAEDVRAMPQECVGQQSDRRPDHGRAGPRVLQGQQ